VIAVRDRTPFGLTRTRADHERLFSRLGRPTWVVRRGNTVQAYLNVSDDEQKTVGEFAGPIDALTAAFRAWLDEEECAQIVVLSPWDHPLNRDFFRLAAGWCVESQRLLKITDLDALLRGFADQLARRWRALGIAETRHLSLGLAGGSAPRRVTFCEHGVAVAAAGPHDRALVLPETEMVRFLFSHAGPAAVVDLPPALAFLGALLPLDYHLWPLEQV
jgi:hypothetical protein